MLHPSPEVHFPWFGIPFRYRQLFGPNVGIKNQLTAARNCNIVPATLSPSSYIPRFRALLWIQELKSE